MELATGGAVLGSILCPACVQHVRPATLAMDWPEPRAHWDSTVMQALLHVPPAQLASVGKTQTLCKHVIGHKKVAMDIAAAGSMACRPVGGPLEVVAHSLRTLELPFRCCIR